MPKRTPTEAASKWATNLGASTPEIEIGVNKVTVAPGQKAVAQQQKMIDNWLQSVESGKWATNTAAIDVNTWKRLMIEVGIGRIRTGATKAVPKLTAYYNKVFPRMEALEGTIAAMPNRDINDSIARATAWMLGMRDIANTL